MTQQRDIEGLLDLWLSDGPNESPDRVLEAVADRIEHQPQRHAWRLQPREIHVNTFLRAGAAVAAVVVVAAVGLYVAGNYAGPGTGGRPSPTPSAASQPSTSPAALSNPFEVVARYDAATLGLTSPIALAVAPNGDLYVTESNDRVSQISPDGTVVRRWGTHGTGPGEFDFSGRSPGDDASSSIAVGPDGKVYVSDPANHRVQVFTADGSVVRQLGTSGNGAGQFGWAWDLSADAAGNVYVLDDDLMRLTKFGPDGAAVWFVDGTTEPELRGHGHDADIDSKGRIVIGNDDTHRVVYVDPDGTVVDAFSAAATCNVTVDQADNTYVGGCGGDRIDVYSASHELVGSWPGSALVATPQFGPNGEIFALGRDGAIVKLKVTLPPG